ncbi:MAG: hypothetical protein H0V68_07850 [Actinobacteria bacterium]|nr:hypothetical protein [Actinomycetota bacterium]
MRRGLFLLPLLALLLLPTACGSEEALDLDPVASAATLTRDAGSARIAFKTAMKMQDRSIELNGAGRFDFDESRGMLTMDVSPLVPAGAGDPRFELRILGSMIYLRMPRALIGQGLPGGKAWVGIDVEKTLKAAGLGSLDPTSLQQDPTQTLRLLRASATSVQEAGTAKIRGVATTRYEAKLDLRKATEATADELGLSERERAALRRAAAQLSTQSGLKTLPVEVYVDRGGLLRRMRMATKTTGVMQFSLTQTTDFYDFGVDVDVQAPPRSQVVDLSGYGGP